MRIGLISDTHGLLDPQVFDFLEGVEMICHAGDLGGHPLEPGDLVCELSAIAPVVAVSGNVDGFEMSGFPRWREVETPAGRLGVTHRAIEGGRKVPGIDEDCAQRGLSLLIYGHSHQPRVHREGQALWINPGSAGPKRFRLPRSLARMTLGKGDPAVAYFDLERRVVFDPPA